MRFSLPYFRLSLVLALLLVEMVLLSLFVDARAIPKSEPLSILLAESGNLLRWIIVSVALFALFLAQNFKHRLNTLLANPSTYSPLLALGLHLLLFSGFFLVTLLVFHEQGIQRSYLTYLWLGLLILSSGSWALMLACKKNCLLFLVQEKISLASALLFGFAIVALSFYFQRYWGSMTEFTLGSTKSLLSLFYDDLIFNLDQRTLGIGDFWVEIAPICSGIEGAVLSVSIAGIYIALSREELKLPHALILLPIACITSILLNIVRIAALIVLGAEVSPALAIGGFHSVAGWISAILVALLIVFVFSSWTWIQKPRQSKDSGHALSADAQLAQAILLPFVVLIGASLVGAIFILDFDYFYPVKIVLVLGMMRYFWVHYRIQFPEKLLESVAVGLLVGIIWIYLIPTNTAFNESTNSAFSSMPLWLLVIWGFFRLVGFWFVAPVLEELVFRSYLLSRLSGERLTHIQAPAYSLIAFVSSSVLFGLLHNAWLAGTIAGLLFALVRVRTQSITNCIVSHASANITITLWVFFTRNWSLV